MNNKQNLGQRTNSGAMHQLLANAIRNKFHLSMYDWVTIHHYTDKDDCIQCEVEFEYESQDCDEPREIEFDRVFLTENDVEL